MGSAHVANLLKKGIKVNVWNRSKGPCERAAALGASVLPSPKDVAAASDVTFVMMSTPEVARLIYTNSATGLLAGITKGKGVVDCASLDASTIRELAGLVQEREGRFCAAPVAGHGGMARNATCQFLCSGDVELYESIGIMLDAMSKNKVWLGTDAGAASNMKLVVNGLLADITASMGEAMALADKAGLKQSALMKIVNGHAMNSPLLQLCAKMMMSGDHPPLFKLELMEKDARLATELHTQVGSPGVVTSAVQQAYAAAMHEGFSASNWTAVHESMKTSKLPTKQNAVGKTLAGGEGGDGDAPTPATSAKA